MTKIITLKELLADDKLIDAYIERLQEIALKELERQPAPCYTYSGLVRLPGKLKSLNEYGQFEETHTLPIRRKRWLTPKADK